MAKKFKTPFTNKEIEKIEKDYLNTNLSVERIAIKYKKNKSSVSTLIHKKLKIKKPRELQASLRHGLKRVYEYKKDKCELCGRTYRLEIHHKDKNRKNNKPENLITLCNYCHARTHISKEKLRKMRESLPPIESRKRDENGRFCK